MKSEEPKVVDLRAPAIGIWIVTAAFVLLAVFGCASAPEPQARAGYGEVRGGLPSPSAERQHRQQGI